MTNFDEFKRSLDSLVNQAQHTARLGLDVAKDQVESIVKNPPAAVPGNLTEQVEEVRENLQKMAREMEARAQELVHLATGVVAPRTGSTGSSQAAPAQPASPAPEPPTNGETATAAGAGTPQEGPSVASSESDVTPNGEAPKQ